MRYSSFVREVDLRGVRLTLPPNVLQNVPVADVFTGTAPPVISGPRGRPSGVKKSAFTPASTPSPAIRTRWLTRARPPDDPSWMQRA